MRNDSYLFIPQGWKQVMELNTKCIFAANTCKMLITLLTSVKEPLKKIVTSQLLPANLITFLNFVSKGTTAPSVMVRTKDHP